VPFNRFQRDRRPNVPKLFLLMLLDLRTRTGSRNSPFIRKLHIFIHMRWVGDGAHSDKRLWECVLGTTSPSGLLTLCLASIAMLPNVGSIANANTLIQLRQAPKLYRISLLDGACLTVRAIAKLFISRTVPICCFVLYFMLSFLMFTRITCPSDLCGIASFSLSRKRMYRVCSCQTDYFVDRVLVPETAIKKQRERAVRTSKPCHSCGDVNFNSTGRRRSLWLLHSLYRTRTVLKLLICECSYLFIRSRGQYSAPRGFIPRKFLGIELGIEPQD
jgi:hypothetical protein